MLRLLETGTCSSVLLPRGTLHANVRHCVIADRRFEVRKSSERVHGTWRVEAQWCARGGLYWESKRLLSVRHRKPILPSDVNSELTVTETCLRRPTSASSHGSDTDASGEAPAPYSTENMLTSSAQAD